MFYERYLSLCKNREISPSAAATAAGFNRGTVSVWKKKFEQGIDVRPEPDVISKVCLFFNCSEMWLLGIEEQKNTATEDGSGKLDQDTQDLIDMVLSMTTEEKLALKKLLDVVKGKGE